MKWQHIVVSWTGEGMELLIVGTREEAQNLMKEVFEGRLSQEQKQEYNAGKDQDGFYGGKDYGVTEDRAWIRENEVPVFALQLFQEPIG